MSGARDAEFLELRAFLHLYATDVKGIAADDPNHPSNVLETILAKYGKSRALAGLRQAIGDTIEETQRLSSAQITKVDRFCRERNVVSLSQLRARYWSKYASVIERGRIRGDTEYHLIVGVLNDLASSATERDRATLHALVNAYEQQQA